MVVTQADSFPKLIRLVERSKAGKQCNCHYLNSVFVPSGFRLLEELSISSLFEYCFNVVILDSESFTFIRALIARFFTVEWRTNPMLTYFKNPLLASQ